MLHYRFYFVLFFFLHRGMWDLSSPTRDWSHTPGIGRRSLNHWTTRGVLPVSFYKWGQLQWSWDGKQSGCGLEARTEGAGPGDLDTMSSKDQSWKPSLKDVFRKAIKWQWPSGLSSNRTDARQDPWKKDKPRAPEEGTAPGQLNGKGANGIEWKSGAGGC